MSVHQLITTVQIKNSNATADKKNSCSTYSSILAGESLKESLELCASDKLPGESIAGTII